MSTQQQHQMDISTMDPTSYFEAALGDMTTSCQDELTLSGRDNLCARSPLCGQKASSN
eukprot:CAMPEP_0194053826 /NCGR_PEP_ID=MMETSP0009_2-20130614/51418_1 /TAXON_ID=210454 /ORGANISM="Grammatophora oceanica, Strain CCMP 410" /LENGTH=57 /DNA_ID=CAMNT_0038702099 /DNA_START=51 /DNA_END=221 /DNA_ORIENTATION=-